MSATLRAEAIAIYSQGLARMDPAFLLEQALFVQGEQLQLRFLDGTQQLPLRGGITLLALGKAAAPMAAAAARLLEGRISRGLVITKEGFALPDLPFPQRECSHPLPDTRGLAAAAEVETLLAEAPPTDVLLVLLSGGSSALLPAPLPGISLEEKQTLIHLMLHREMDIHQMNRVRQALSRFKGGGLAALAAPRPVVGLLLSDVPGDAPGSIGSGPTVPQAVDGAALSTLLREKGIWEQISPAIRAALQHSRPPPAPPVPPLNGLIGANRHLRQALAAAAGQAGFEAGVEDHPFTGPNAKALPALLARWEAFCRTHPRGPLCLVGGGETLVEVKGKGLGGRCQQLAALALPALGEDTVFLAAGSDGNDGPTDAAGGVVDAESWRRVQKESIPYAALLADDDSYHLLARSGNLIKVAPTRNNLMDVYMFLRRN